MINSAESSDTICVLVDFSAPGIPKIHSRIYIYICIEVFGGGYDVKGIHEFDNLHGFSADG